MNKTYLIEYRIASSVQTFWTYFKSLSNDLVEAQAEFALKNPSLRITRVTQMVKTKTPFR